MNPTIMMILLSLCTLSLAHDQKQHSKMGCRQREDNECEECQVGYAWWEDECMVVPIDVYGVVVDEEVYKCYGACIRCSALSTCTQCMQGFNLVDDMCKPCPPGCKHCNQSGCEQCSDRYYEHEGGCVVCMQNCLECDNADECHQCVSGYYPSQDGCVLCSDRCSKCSSAESCSECLSGYMVHPQTGKCMACMMGCEYCTLDTYDSCQKHDTDCADNCKKCSEDQQCTQCNYGYHLYMEKLCASNCDFPCLTCEWYRDQWGSDWQGSSWCSSCFGGYELEEDKGNCVPTSCARGEYEDDGCHSCAVENCQHCVDGSQVCYQCSRGYYLSSVESCSLCPANCEGCLSEGYCTVCREGFFMVMGEDGEATGICHPCSENCLSCSNNPDHCIQCAQDYWDYFGRQGQCWPYGYLMVKIVLDISMEDFVRKVEEIKTVIMGFLGTEYENRNDLVSLQSLSEGSVVANFYLFILPQHRPREVGYVLEAALQENMKIDNITVISFNIRDSLVCNTRVGCFPQPPDSPLIALPFIIVGSLVLIGLAVFAARKRCKGKESTVNAEPQISEKEDNQVRTNANSASNIAEYEIA